MRSKIFVCAVCVMLLPLCVSVEAQQPGKIPTIGYMTVGGSVKDVGFVAFTQGLRDIGYIEGKNVAIEFRSAEAKLDPDTGPGKRTCPTQTRCSCYHGLTSRPCR